MQFCLYNLYVPNHFKTAYIKYVSSLSKYLEIVLEDNSKILISTSLDHFPHLVGKPYIPKYSNIPKIKFIADIINEVIDNSVLYKLNNLKRSIVTRKIKAIKKLDSLKNGFCVQKDLQISKHIDGNTFIYKIIKNEAIMIVLKKGKFNIYHPKSILLLKTSSRKFLKINAEAKKKIIKVNKYSKKPN